MAKNFKTDNFKCSKETSRTDIYNPAFNNNVKLEDQKEDSFHQNLNKWILFIQWAKWFPDLWYDMLKPEKGGMRLDLDQRVF